MRIGFYGLLTILFIGLKMTNYITWSWIWVLSPLWGPFVSIFVIFPAVVFVGAFIVVVLEEIFRRW